MYHTTSKYNIFFTNFAHKHEHRYPNNIYIKTDEYHHSSLLPCIYTHNTINNKINNTTNININYVETYL